MGNAFQGGAAGAGLGMLIGNLLLPGIGGALGGALAGGLSGASTGQQNANQKAANASMNALGAQQQQQEMALSQQLLTQPKAIAPDNFLANKNAQIKQLRMGLASTMTGAGGAPSPVLSSPSLAAGGMGKTKFGQ